MWTHCGAQKRPSSCMNTPQAVLHWAHMKHQYFVPQRCKCLLQAFFQVQTIKRGHISKIYRKTGDILSDSSQDTKVTSLQLQTLKWQKIISRSDNFANTESTDSKFSQQLCFSSMQRMTSMHCLCNAGASHCKITAAKIGHSILP